MARLLVVLLLLVAALVPGVRGQACVVPVCCEEDCCGAGASWDTGGSNLCIVDAASPGFDGTHGRTAACNEPAVRPIAAIPA